MSNDTVGELQLTELPDLEAEMKCNWMHDILNTFIPNLARSFPLVDWPEPGCSHEVVAITFASRCRDLGYSKNVCLNTVKLCEAMLKLAPYYPCSGCKDAGYPDCGIANCWKVVLI